MKTDKSTVLMLAVLIAVAAVFLLLLKTNLGGSDKKAEYNGFEFVSVNGLWQTQWQRANQVYVLEFRHTPQEVESIPVTGKTDIRFQLQDVYITFDASNETTPEQAYLAVAAAELTRKLTTPFERNVIAACTSNETEACYEREIITCSNTNSSVIYLKQSEEAKIELKGNCAVLSGKGENLVRAADKALFQWLGIMR